MQTIALHTPPDVFSLYVSALHRIHEQQAVRDVNELAREELARAVERAEAAERTLDNLRQQAGLTQKLEADLALEDRAQRLRLRVIDEILTLRCPGCRAAFAHFDGCAVLKCHQSGCPCSVGGLDTGFCACCLQPCPSGAHMHVMLCKWNAYRSPFLTWAQFDEMQRQRRFAELQDFFDGLDDDIMRCLLAALLSDELRDLRIDSELLISSTAPPATSATAPATSLPIVQQGMQQQEFNAFAPLFEMALRNLQVGGQQRP